MVPSFQVGFPRSVLAPALILWMAGVGCVFGCERATGTAENSANAAAPADSCAGHRAHDCCAGKNKAVRKNIPITSFAITTFRESRSELGECPMSLNSNAAITKGSAHDGALTTDQASLQSPTIVGSTRLRSNPLPSRNRSGTYLRCCVFLI